MSEKIVLEITPEVARKIQDFLVSGEKIAPDEADAWDQIVQQMGGNMKRSMIEWHKYPEEKPSDSGRYLVYSFRRFPTEKTGYIIISTWDLAFERFLEVYPEDGEIISDKVLAWACLPE